MSSLSWTNFQNCDTCALTYPHCGKTKRVGQGHCRTPYVSKFATNEIDLTQSVKTESFNATR